MSYKRNMSIEVNKKFQDNTSIIKQKPEQYKFIYYYINYFFSLKSIWIKYYKNR